MKKLSILVTLLLLAISTPIIVAAEQYVLPGCRDPLVDYACQARKLLNPESPCQIVYCGDNANTNDIDGSGVVHKLNVFGVTLRLNNDRAIAQIIFLVFSAFFGISALAVMVYGLYGSYIRSKAESDDDIVKATKIMRNAIVGILLMVASIVIVQIVAGILGLGSINQLADFSNLLPV